MPDLLLGKDASDHLVIRVTGYAIPEAEDFWDGNWVCAEVSARAGGFRAALNGQFRTDELARFQAELTTLHERLTGTATFESLEHWLRIEVAGDGKGHLRATCELREGIGLENQLRFWLAFDQTDLPPTLDSLGQLMRTYPVKGSRESPRPSNS